MGEDRIDTLSSYVPQAVLRYLGTTSGLPTEPHSTSGQAALLLVDVTGFTPITALAIKRGPAAIEQLSRTFNAYLGQIIDLVREHGGDVAKIVGDAVIAYWAATDEDLPTACRRAASCALAIGELGEYEETGIRLSVTVGLSAGETAEMHVGGGNDRWLFLISGAALRQFSGLHSQLVTGDVIASPEAWSMISDRFVGQPLRDGHVRVRSTGTPVDPRPLEEVRLSPSQNPAVRAYIPRVALSRIDAGQEDWLAELRQTSVVFLNVRGLMDGEDHALVEVNRLAGAAQAVVERFDGWLKEVTMDEKGTTLTIAFGVPPFTHEDDASRAVRTALALESQIRSLGLRAGVGIASGPTFVGPAGNHRRRDFTMLGSHVNLAARLMQAAEDGTVLCDVETQRVARDDLSFERLPAYVLKGLGTPTDVFRVATERDAAEQPSTLVDRTVEMAAMTSALDRLVEGHGGLVVLDGDPGIGKTRLLTEAVDRALQRGVQPYSGRASEIEQSTHYHAWRAVFESLLDLGSTPERPARAEIVRRRLEDAGLNGALAPLLSSILSLDLTDNELTAQLAGEARADNTLDLLIGLLRWSTSNGPIMVTLEDVHWLDSASEQLVDRAGVELDELLLVLTTRPVADDPAEGGEAARAQATRIHLGAFSRQDAVTLAAQRSGATQLDTQVATLLDERAEGNPLFIEQLTYALRDSGQIVVDRGLLRSSDQANGLASAGIPDSVQRVITTRLDKLPPAQAMTLKVGSVIGQRFAVSTLADIHPQSSDPAVLASDLDTLTRLGLLVPANAPEPAFEFRHKITHEVAYNLMPQGQSRQLHHNVAEWYERAHADDLSPFLAFLAYQWRQAGEPARSLDYLERAGIGALHMFANEETIDFLREALTLDTDANLATAPHRRAGWLLAVGDAYVNLSRYREGRDNLEDGLRLLKRSPPTSRMRRVGSLLYQIVRQLGHRIGLHGVRRLSDDERAELVAVSRAYERLAEAAYYEGDTMLALYSSIRILNEAEASGSAPEIARGNSGTGALFGLVPLPRVARSYLGRAEAELDNTDDATTHEIVRIVIGFYHVGAGAWETAREQFNSVRSTARRIGDRRRLLDSVSNLLEMEILQGQVRSALDLADEVIALARARSDARFEADALVGRAYALLEMDRPADALSALEEVREIALRAQDLPELRIKTNGMLAMVQLARNDRIAAGTAADEAMRLTQGQRPAYFGTYFGYVGPATVYLNELEVGGSAGDIRPRVDDAIRRLKGFADVFPIGRPRYHLLAGRRAWLLGDRRAAQRHWRKALDEAARLAMPYEQALAHYEIGRHLEDGDPDRSRHMDAAREAVASVGASRLLTIVLASIGSGALGG